MKAILLAAVLGVGLSTGAFAQTESAPQAPAAASFPSGAKVAYINVQQIANDSAQGRQSSQRVQALNEQKVGELADLNKQLQASQQKLQQSGSVLSDAARVQLEREIERLNRDLQRFTEDAQAEVRNLQEELQAEFQQKLLPVIEQVATEMDLHMIFSQLDAGLVWANPGLDITQQIIERFDAANPASASGTGSGAAPQQP